MWKKRQCMKGTQIVFVHKVQVRCKGNVKLTIHVVGANEVLCCVDGHVKRCKNGPFCSCSIAVKCAFGMIWNVCRRTSPVQPLASLLA